MDTRRFTVGTALTLVAAYLGLFVGLIDANAINLALPAVRTDLGGGIAGARARAARLRSGAYVLRPPRRPTRGADHEQSAGTEGLVGGDGRYDARRDSHDALSSVGYDIDYALTDGGRDFLEDIGVELPTGRRPLVRYCVDWTEQRHHLSGGLGRAVLDRTLSAGWVKRVPRGRAVTVTDKGCAALAEVFGIDWVV
jgi:hypothetical protein